MFTWCVDSLTRWTIRADGHAAAEAVDYLSLSEVRLSEVTDAIPKAKQTTIHSQHAYFVSAEQVAHSMGPSGLLRRTSATAHVP